MINITKLNNFYKFKLIFNISHYSDNNIKHFFKNQVWMVRANGSSPSLLPLTPHALPTCSTSEALTPLYFPKTPSHSSSLLRRLPLHLRLSLSAMSRRFTWAPSTNATSSNFFPRVYTKAPLSQNFYCSTRGINRYPWNSLSLISKSIHSKAPVSLPFNLHFSLWKFSNLLSLRVSTGVLSA